MSSEKEKDTTIRSVPISRAFRELDSYLAEHDEQGSPEAGWVRLKRAIETANGSEALFGAGSPNSSATKGEPTAGPLPTTSYDKKSPEERRTARSKRRRNSAQFHHGPYPRHRLHNVSRILLLVLVTLAVPSLVTASALASFRVPLLIVGALAIGVVVRCLARMALENDRDALTRLLNRRGFDRALSGAIERATTTGETFSLALVDIDHFRKINDHLGYNAGDTVLQRVADTWSKLLAPDQRLARYGGDAFALLLPNTTEQAAILLTEQMRNSVTIRCSVGVTSWQPGESASLLVSRANVGLYRAKQAGRNQTVLESSRELPLAVELREAIDRGALDVCYQPIVSLTEGGGKAIGVEARMRWSSSAQPDVTTEGLIRVAEEHDLLSDLDELVLRRACADAARLQETFAALDLTLNVNVSGLELAEASYVDRVAEILASTGFPASRLVLGVTDSDLAAGSRTAIDNLHELRAQGVRIAIDDFGTGYSSLSSLATLPSDILRVDRDFVAAIRSDSPTPPLLSVIAALSNALDLQVIAEGVENEHQAAVLTELGFALTQADRPIVRRSQAESPDGQHPERGAR